MSSLGALLSKQISAGRGAGKRESVCAAGQKLVAQLTAAFKSNTRTFKIPFFTLLPLEEYKKVSALVIPQTLTPAGLKLSISRSYRTQKALPPNQVDRASPRF